MYEVILQCQWCKPPKKLGYHHFIFFNLTTESLVLYKNDVPQRSSINKKTTPLTIRTNT